MKRAALLLPLRLTALLLIALPLTSLFEHPLLSEPQFALVLDVSPSMEERFSGFAADALEDWAEVGSGEHPVIAFSDYPLGHPGIFHGGEAKFTDLPAALRRGAEILPSAAEKRLLLVTDGLTRMEGLRDSLSFLRESKIRVYALAPPPASRKAGAVELVLPERAFLWEPFSVKAVVSASSAGEVRAELKRNGVTIQETEIRIDETGFGEAEFIQEADRVGTLFFSLSLPDFDAPPAGGTIRIATAPRVRYIADDPTNSRRLIEIFRGAGIDVIPSTPADLIYSGGSLEEDVIVLDDLPAPALGEDIMESLRKAISLQGRGLLVLGGRRSLGTEDYRDSAIEALLPVTAGYSTPPDPPPISLVLAMDTSFSMYFRGQNRDFLQEGGPRKIDVARESAREIVRAARAEDRFGMIGNSDDLYWINALAPVTDRPEIIDRIDRIEARGGGLDFYSIILESYRSLEEDPGRIRHVLLLCDAEDIDQQEVEGVGHAFDLIREMSRKGITLSILAIGQPGDKDVPFLRTASLLGHGDFYLVSDLRTLPRYSVSEYRKLASRHFIEEEIRTSPGEFSQLLHGITGPLPPLSGMALVTPRKGSETPIRTDAGVPLLTVGNYGKGGTAVFSSDSGYRWAERWVQWSEAQRFWLQLLFAVAPRDPGGGGSFSVLTADRIRDRYVFRHRTGSEALPPWDRLRLSVIGSGLPPVDLVRTGLTEYLSLEGLPDPGFYRFAVAGGDDGESTFTETSLTVPPSFEKDPYPENWPLIHEIVRASGGRWISLPEEVTSGATYYKIEKKWLVMLALAGGLLLLLVETVITRNPWR